MAFYPMSPEITRIVFILLGSLVVTVQLINVLLGFKNLNQFSSALKWFLGYLIFSFASELLSILFYYNGWHNIWIINVYTIGEFLFIAGFFRSLIFPSAKGKLGISLAIVLIAMGYLFYFLVYKDITEFSSFSETLENVLLMAFCIYYFVFSLSHKPDCKEEEVNLVKWLVVSLFVYLSGIILIWLFYEFLGDEKFENLNLYLAYANSFLNLGFKIAILASLLSYDHRIRRMKVLGVPFK